MKMFTTRCIYLFLLVFLLCRANALVHFENLIEGYQEEIDKWLNDLDADLLKFNSLASHLTWKLSTIPDERTSAEAIELGVARNKWKNRLCDSYILNPLLRYDQRRKLYLFCRGPRFTEELSRAYIQLMGQLTQAYNTERCFSEEEVISWNAGAGENEEIAKLIFRGLCVYGEPDLERLIKRMDLNSSHRKWIWKAWHDFVGPKIKQLYPIAIQLQNLAARNNGYHDMGEIWREELEIPDLEKQIINLYNQIKPLYELLHAVTRHKLWQKYGSSEIDPSGPIPVHLLGNMWGQDWSALIDLIIPANETVDLQARLNKKSWTICDMVYRAEDMYTSMGLPPMTEKFWKYSIFEKNQNTSMCHGTAANLYSTDDYRILLCAKQTMEDFYVIHHEMGHIEYYMAYQNQPVIFQDGTNSAFHESIGDAIMHGVMVPQHLHRLNLISDDIIGDKHLDQFLLLQQALTKLPELAYSLVIDKYRWDIFNGKIKVENYNKAFWELNRQFRGVVPPEPRSEQYFDAGAKFHISDNTPYIRYFLSSIIQMEIFNSLCELALFGRNLNAQDKDERYSLPLHRCDIYGSKKSGKALRKMMEVGASEHWSKVLGILTGREYISTETFLNYYDLVYLWLKKYVDTNNIPVGW